MGLNSLNYKKSSNGKGADTPISKEVDFLRGMSDKDIGPKPEKVNVGGQPKGFSKSRFNDSLFATSGNASFNSIAPVDKATKPKPNFDRPAVDKPKPNNQVKDVSRDTDNPEDDHSFVVNQTVITDNIFSDIFDKIKEFIKKNLLTKKGRGIEVNLVKDEVAEYFDWQKNVVYLLAVIVFAFSLLIFFYWGISWWGNKLEYERSSTVLQDYYKISKQVQELEGQINDVVSFQYELNVVNSLLDKHVYWTNFFDFLEQNTLADVYFLSFSGNTQGEYSLSGQTKSFDALDAQVKKFLQNENVVSAKIDRGSLVGGTNVSFSLDFSLNPDIFNK